MMEFRSGNGSSSRVVYASKQLLRRMGDNKQCCAQRDRHDTNEHRDRRYTLDRLLADIVLLVLYVHEATTSHSLLSTTI